MALLFLVEAVQSLPVTGENIYPESAGVLTAQRWGLGFPLYQDYRQPPYLVTPFPPLWYAFMAIPVKLGLTTLDSLTLFGRMLTLAFLLGIAGLGHSWNHRLGLSSSLALFTPALYLSFPILTPWAVNARPDFPALFFSLLAIYWVGTRSSPVSVFVAGTAAALAFLMRHNAVAAPVAIVLWLMWFRRWTDAWRFCATWTATVALILVPVYWASNGLLLLNLSGAKFGPLAITYVHDVLSRLLVTEGNGFAVVLFAFGTFAFIECCKQANERTHLINIYAIASLGLAIAGSAAAGADANHYLEPALAMALLAPIGMSRLADTWRADSPLVSFAVVLILLLLLPSLDTHRWKFLHMKRAQLQQVLPLIDKKSIFTDIPYFSARTTSPQLVDLASLINTERVGGWAGWSSALVVEALQKKDYELVILSQPVDMLYVPAGLYPRWPRVDSAMKKAIRNNYGLCFRVDDVHVDGPLYVYGRLLQDSTVRRSSCPPINGIDGLSRYARTTPVGQ
jgi:hypothetical protein